MLLSSRYLILKIAHLKVTRKSRLESEGNVSVKVPDISDVTRAEGVSRSVAKLNGRQYRVTVAERCEPRGESSLSTQQ